MDAGFTDGFCRDGLSDLVGMSARVAAFAFMRSSAALTRSSANLCAAARVKTQISKVGTSGGGI